MVLGFDVYLFCFWTEAGTYREYVGYTGNSSKREEALKKGGSNWTKPMKKGTSKPLQFFAVGIRSKAVARCRLYDGSASMGKKAE